jgi:hypothetical protein
LKIGLKIGWTINCKETEGQRGNWELALVKEVPVQAMPCISVAAQNKKRRLRSKTPVAATHGLRVDIQALGAVNVRELCPEDWAALPSWPSLKALEQRRLLSVMERQ